MPRRKFDVFSMSFLDAICCGFGAVVLIFMLITAQGTSHVKKKTEDLRSEALLVEQQVQQAQQNLVEAKNSIELLDRSKVTTAGLADRVKTEIKTREEELASAQNESLAARERLEKLKADIQALEEGTKRLEASSKRAAPGGENVRGFKGNGDRMYLTGMRVGGQRILILVDASSSMLDEQLVNILRVRNMSDDRKVRTEKWRQTVSIVEWIATQIPAGAQVQIYTFNTRPTPLLAGTEGQWQKVDGPTMEKALTQIRKVVPTGGTSLENAFNVIKAYTPAPDNVILITDGLPTQADTPPTFKKLVDGDDRLKFFERAIRVLPRKLPINVILLPMEGDPAGQSAFWNLAKATGGSVISPSKDWP
jgi:hypothetical protein